MNRHKLFFFALPVVILAGCSGANEDRSTSSQSLSVKEEEPMAATESAADASAGPDVRVSAAPGVAFNYRYAFRVPDAMPPPVKRSASHAAGSLECVTR